MDIELIKYLNDGNTIEEAMSRIRMRLTKKHLGEYRSMKMPVYPTATEYIITTTAGTEAFKVKVK